MLEKEPPTEAVKRWLGAALGPPGANAGQRKALAAHCGVTTQAVSGWLRTGRIGKDKLELAAAFLGSKPNFNQPGGPQLSIVSEPGTHWTKTHSASERPASAGINPQQAHHMSHAERIIEPPTLKWDSMMSSPLPARFQLVIRDAAMPPMQPGHRAIFVPATQAQPGQVVLVVDSAGDAYIREYHERTPKRWQAVARSPAWLPLDSVTDGLVIVAVQVGWTWD
jgi:hypothetical protein